MTTPQNLETAAREAVARAIWNIRRDSEDRLDMELEDMGPNHSVWLEADAAIAALTAALSARTDAEAWQPKAWLHTLHMEYDQTNKRLTFSPENPFGVPGKNYSAEYRVTSEPLYSAPPALRSTTQTETEADERGA